MLAHKIALKLNNKQATYCSKAAGVARKAYNWALNEWQQQYAAGQKPTEAALRRELNHIKREKFPWMLEVSKNAPQMAIIQLGRAFQNFFAGRANYPKFRKKYQDDRFTLTNDQFVVKGSQIRIPHLGWVRMHESLRFEGKILSATISCKAGKWFVSITVDVLPKRHSIANDNQVAVGVDLGISCFAQLSTGEKVMGPKPHKALLGKLKRLSKSLSRKQKRSKNRDKAIKKLARLHQRIANIRNDATHQLTTRLTKNFSVIGIEDLNVKGMMRNRRLSRSLADMGFGEFRRQLDYKAKLHEATLYIADRWYASSKTCSVCDYQLEKLSLSIRHWQCLQCKTNHDRDLNAAKNLEKMAVSFTVTACGASADGAVALATASYDALKQESNIKPIHQLMDKFE